MRPAILYTLDEIMEFTAIRSRTYEPADGDSINQNLINKDGN